MISIILYPIIVFCGLIITVLFTDVQFEAIDNTVRFVILCVQICSIIAAFIV